jgi:actin-like ATPase involved in cell morphogenesis
VLSIALHRSDVNSKYSGDTVTTRTVRVGLSKIVQELINIAKRNLGRLVTKRNIIDTSL